MKYILSFNLMKLIVFFLFLVSSCSFFIHKRHKVEPLTQKNMDSFDDYSKGKVEKCFRRKNIGDDEFFAAYIVVKIDSAGKMEAQSYYPKVNEFDYECLKGITERFVLTDSTDFNSIRRLKIVQYK